MLLPRKVEEIVVSVPAHLYDLAVAATVEAGVLHVAGPPRIEGGKVSREYRVFYAQVSERVSRIEGFFRAAGEKPWLVGGVSIEAGGWIEAFEKYTSEYRDLEEFYEAGVQRLQEIENTLGELRTVKAVIEPISHVDADIRKAYQETAFVGFSIGYASVKDPSVLEEALERVTEKHKVVAVVEEVDKDRYAIAIAGAPAAVAVAMQEMRKLSWTPISLPEDLPGSPKRALEKINEMLSSLVKEYEDVVERLRSRLKELAKYYTILVSLRHAAEILANTVRTRTFALFRGYVDTRDRKKLNKKLAEALGGAFIITVLGVKKAHERAEKPPTKVDLPRIVRPFHNIVRMYGEPDPDEIVPTIFLAVTMPLIFALMFPDMGHGLLVVLFALYMMDKKSVWRPVLIILGLASIVTGFLAGEFFGPVTSEKIGLYAFWEKLGFEAPPLSQPTYAIEHHLGEELTRLLMFRIMSISLWLAGFMLSFGALLGLIDAWIKGEKGEAIASKLPSFIFFLSVSLPFLVTMDAARAGVIIKEALFNAGAGGPLQAIVWWGVIASIVWKMLGGPILAAVEGGSALHALGHSFMEAYEMLAMAISNIPSFLRILGLGLAHAGLMMGFAQLYHIMAGGGIIGVIGGIIVYAIGNLMVAALEAIIAIAHSIRLHFYEWFNKFYSGQGIPFSPVRLEGVRIILRAHA